MTSCGYDAGHRCLVEDEKRWHPGPDRDGKVRCGDLLDIELDHHVFDDLRRFAAQFCRRASRSCVSTMRPFKPDARASSASAARTIAATISCKSVRPSTVSAEGLFVNMWVFRADPVTDRAVGDGRQIGFHDDNALLFIGDQQPTAIAGCGLGQRTIPWSLLRRPNRTPKPVGALGGNPTG